MVQAARMAKLQESVFPKIAYNCKMMLKEKWLGLELQKLYVDWKTRHITGLLEHLRDVMRLHCNNFWHAQYGQGNFQLATLYLRHYALHVKW